MKLRNVFHHWDDRFLEQIIPHMLQVLFDIQNHAKEIKLDRWTLLALH